MSRTNWTPEQIDRMRVLWNQGQTAQKIAEALKAEFQMDVSRSAVLGKVHRHKRSMNFVKRTAGLGAGRPKKAPAPDLVEKKRKEAPALVDGIPPQPLAVLGRRRCRWPVNDPQHGEIHLFCSAATAYDGPYCAHHRHMSLQNPGAKPKPIEPPP